MHTCTLLHQCTCTHMCLCMVSYRILLPGGIFGLDNVACHPSRGSGGMHPQENFGKFAVLRLILVGLGRYLVTAMLHVVYY